MARKLLLLSIVLIIAGLSLIVYTDPQFRFVLSSAGAGNFSTTRSFNGTFPGFGNGTFPRTGSGGFGGRFGFNATSVIESLLGVGLIGVGIVLVGIETFVRSARPKVKAP